MNHIVEVSVGLLVLLALVPVIIFAFRPIRYTVDGTVVRLGEHHGPALEVKVSAQAVRRQVREEGYTFEGTPEYLRKYHGFRHFNFLGARYGNEDWGNGPQQLWVIEIQPLSPAMRLRNWFRGYHD